MPDFTIEEVPAPTTLEGAAGALFGEIVEVHNVLEVAGYGIPELAVTPAELLPHFLEPGESGRYVVARVDGRVVGYGTLEYLVAAPESGTLDVRVLPDYQRRGIGRGLAVALEEAARAIGQNRLVTYAVHPDAAGPRLTAPTGFGTIPAGNGEVRFLLAQGWTFEQVARGSRFALPGDAALLAAARAEAESHAGEYRLVSWAGATPEPWRDGIALLNTRMSTDEPTGNIDEPEDVWDAERLLISDGLILDSPQQLIVTAAQHHASGEVVGMTRMVVPHDVARPVNQWATIVLDEHRGHRLGMLLKTTNLQVLEREAPGHPSVLTWNAEENLPMLAVNDAIGFVPIGSEGVWAKRLA